MADDELRQHLIERGTYLKHAVTITEIVEVHQGSPKYFLNTAGGGSAPVITLGLTMNRRMLCIPLDPSDQEGKWRPRTAFEANKHHRDKYEGGP